MTTILYHLVDGKVIEARVKTCKVHGHLKNGYCVTEEQLLSIDKADTNKTGKLSSLEIKEAAKEAGITIGNKSMKTLKKELGL